MKYSKVSLVLIALILVSTLSSYATYSFLVPKVSALKMLDVQISPDGAELSLGQRQMFQAIINNGTAPFTILWYSNSTYVGSGPSIDFSFKEPCIYVSLQVDVKDSLGQVGSNLVFVYDPLSFTTTIEPGSMVSSYSYLIFTDGLAYYARNGLTAAIDYSGTNAKQIIQFAMDSGTSIFIKSGTYLITPSTGTDGLTTTRTNEIYGEKGTILEAGSLLTGDVIYIVNDNTKISNIEIDGNQYSQRGIDIWNSSNCIIQDCDIHNVKEYGISIVGAGDYANYNIIQRNYVHELYGGTYGTGILITSSPHATGHQEYENKILNNVISNVSEHGLKAYGTMEANNEEALYTLIQGNTISETGATGISIQGRGNKAIGNNINNTAGAGIYTGEMAIISDNYIQLGTNGISISGNDTIVSNNIISYCTAGIRIAGDYNTLNNNLVLGGTTCLYVISGSQNNIINGLQTASSTGTTVNEESGADYNIYTNIMAKYYIFLTGANSEVHLSYNGTVWIP